MWQIRRIYLDAIGTPAGRFIDVTLDLADGRGRPLDSILWLRNGGGKSTIMALVGALIRPGRNDFLSATERRNDAGRHLEDYVLGSDTAHVAVEWGDGDRRLISGAVYEWADRVQPADPTTSHDRLGQRWYSFFPDGDRAELGRLPFKVAGRPTHEEAFCSAVKALPASAEPVVAKTQAEWEKTLTSRGIDPDLWRTILQMNESEGGIEHQFLFADADEFVHYLLRLIVDPEIPNGVAKILGSVVAELAARPAVEADLRFCADASERLTELDAAWRTSAEAAELVRIATADARVLRASLLAAAEIAEVEALETKEASEKATAEAIRHRSAADVARDTGNEYARLAAVLRERAADAKIKEIGEALRLAEHDRDAWKAAPLIAELNDLAARRATLTDAMRAAEQDAAPLAERRAATANAFAAGLGAVMAKTRAEVATAKAAAATATAAATTARTEHGKALRQAADLEAALSVARRAVERFEADLANARASGVIEADETPGTAASRLATLDGHDAAREQELRTTIDEARAAVARARDGRDALVLAVERARADARTARRVRDELVARRDALAADPRMAVYLPAEDADIVGMGRPIRDAIADALRRAEGALIDLALDGADDARAVAAIDETDLLPPAPDLARAAGVLDAAGVSAVTGWTYLADAISSPERRLAAFLGSPELASGLLVQNPDDLERARELLADEDLRPTSLVALGTTAELHAASEGEPAPGFAVPPNPALFDADRAAEERERREAAVEHRTELRARIEADRETDRALHDRLATLLRDLPPDRLPGLDRSIEALDATATEQATALGELDRRIRADGERAAAADAELRTVGERRRQTGRSRARTDALVATAAAAAGDREAIAALPDRIAAAKAAATAADEAERAENEKATIARLRASALEPELDRYAERAAPLPVTLAVGAPALPAGWSLDVLEAAWKDADAAWTNATVGSAIAQELVEVERVERHRREDLAAIEPEVRERAESLLGTSDGQSPMTRARAVQVAEAVASGLAADLGEARGEKKTAHVDVERWEASRDRQRHRAVDEPASVDEALDRERECRVEQETETRLRAEAEDLARREDKRAGEASMRASSFADQANTIEVPEHEGPRTFETPFEGTVEEARAKAREVSRSLAAMNKDEQEARRKLDAVASAIVAWAGHDDWATVKAEVRSRFRTPDVATELGPIAARFRDDEIELRRVELAEHLRGLDEHRTNVINHAVGMVRSALRSLARFSALSKLPEDLGGWSGQRFIEVAPKTPPEDRDEAVMRDRVGRAVDGLIAQQTASIAGMDLLWRALREVVGPTGFRARVLKPAPTFSTERIGVERMRKWSGGEKVTMALLLFVAVAKLRAANRGKELAGAGALVLDNPLGKANYVLFLALQRRVAASAGVQLVFLTGVADMKAVGLFPNVVRMRNAADPGRRRGYVQVTDRDVRDEDEIAHVTATRVYRIADEPTLTLV